MYVICDLECHVWTEGWHIKEHKEDCTEEFACVNIKLLIHRDNVLANQCIIIYCAVQRAVGHFCCTANCPVKMSINRRKVLPDKAILLISCTLLLKTILSAGNLLQ